MMLEHEDLADIISRIVPEEAQNVEALLASSAHAAAALTAELPAIRDSIKVWPDHLSVRRSELARLAAKRARELRNDWLKANEAFVHG